MNPSGTPRDGPPRYTSYIGTPFPSSHRVFTRMSPRVSTPSTSVVLISPAYGSTVSTFSVRS